MKTHKKLFFSVVFLQFLALSGMVGFKYSVILTGQEVVLDTRPVDPRDLMRGDYVRLRFTITRVDQGRLVGNYNSFKKGDDIYVTLKEQGNVWTAVKASNSLPEFELDRAVIRGKVTEVGKVFLTVDYGIDSYYIPEGQGRKYERVRFWKVALDRRGNAVMIGPADKK